MTSSNRFQQIRRVLIATLIANIAVALAKLTVGLLTGILSMVADGFHSLLDGASNIIGLAGTALAARPPDHDHPYGHRRFETLASLMVGGMLLVTGWELLKGAISRLSEGSTPHVEPVNFVAMIATLIVNIAVTLYERREGKRLKSEFLLADSEHTRSDVLVSLAVLASLIAVRFFGLGWADAAATLVVVALIGLAAWRIVRHSAQILVDAAAIDPDRVTRIVADVPGIQAVKRVRSRGPIDEAHLDLDVEIAALTTTAHSDLMAHEIRERLRDRLGGLSDIQVHFVPAQNQSADYALVARAEGDALGLGVHEVIATTTQGKLGLEMHIEVPPEQSIGAAHDMVSVFEERLKKAVPELDRIVTHIEPAHTLDTARTDGGTAHQLAHKTANIARKLYPKNHWHDLDIRAEADGGYAVSMHCLVPADTPLEAAHRLAEDVETHVRATLPMIHRVTIHTEPPEEKKAASKSARAGRAKSK